MNNVEFAANEITRETQNAGISSGYTTLMSEANTMSNSQQAELTQDLVNNGTLPKLSLAFLQDDMNQNGLTSIDKQGVDGLKTSADSSNNPLQAAMADSLDQNFDQDSETRRVAGGRFGVMKTAIFADPLSDGNAQSPGSTNTSGDGSSNVPDVSEQVKSDDSYWSLAKQALGVKDDQPLSNQEDRQIFGLMHTLQNENGNAMLQPGDTVTIHAGDVQAARSLQA